MRAARHEVIARAFRCRPGKHRGLDVDESFRIEKLPHRAGDARPGLDAGEHLRTAQVHVSVPQSRLLADVGLVELEWRCPRRIQDFETRSENLDRAGRHLGVDRAGRSLAHPALDTQDILGAHLLGGCERLDGVRVVDHLDEPRTIAQIDEDHAPVVATSMHPAAKRHALADEILGDGAAEVGTHRIGAGENKARDGKDWRFASQPCGSGGAAHKA